MHATPATNQFGTATVTVVAADDAGGTNEVSFLLTVRPVNDAPTLASLPDLAVELSIATDESAACAPTHGPSASDACDETCRDNGCTPFQHACRCCHAHAPTLAPERALTNAPGPAQLSCTAMIEAHSSSPCGAIDHPPRS